MLGKKFIESQWGKNLQNELKPIEDEIQKSGEKGPVRKELTKLSYNTDPCTQFFVVSGRTLKNIFRNPRTSTVQVNLRKLLLFIDSY